METMKKPFFKRQKTLERGSEQKVFCKGQTGQKTQKIKDMISGQLIRRPVLTICVIILILSLIPFAVRGILQVMEAFVRANGFRWLSLSGSLGNWFAFFGSYCGVLATVVLGILAVRLTIKQDQSKDYADINNLELSSFCLYDLWRYYQPSCYGEDPGRRFVLVFEISGLKPYYSITKIEALWSPAEADNEKYVCLVNLAIKQERTKCTKVKCCFDDFDRCATKDSFNYFFRLGCYEHEMMSPDERQRLLKLRFEIHYADGSNVRYVECKYRLEYTGVEIDHVMLSPVNHTINISSRSK